MTNDQRLIIGRAAVCQMMLAIVGTLCLALISATASAEEVVSRKVTAADMPRIPHTEAGDAVKSFRLAKGFELELVAAEPLLGDPVDACFDEFGRMFVAEMHGYPFSQEPTKLNPAGGGKKDAGIIRMLEDTDGDGRMDKSVVFADRISWPTSVCCYNGGIFVIAPQYLYYFKDTDGDGKADVREVVLSGFGRDNVQSVTNGLKWDLDNRIYFAAGRNPKTLLHRGKPLFPTNGSDLRFNPKTEEFEVVTGGLQFGHSMDNWGTRFVCSNSNHIQQVVYPRDYLARNPYFVASGTIRSVASDGASARVFRLSPPEPWRIIRQKWRAADKGYKLIINADGGWEFIPLDPSKKKGAVPTEYPVGYFTSATGITIYRGNAYPPEYRGNAFVGDVGGNLVHRKILHTDHVIYRADRADEGEEFVASPDNWFRPVNFVNAPDGTLYVLDMYRETVEHPYSIPEEIKKFLHLTSGSDRGRVYRLVSPDMKRIQPIKLGDLSNAELVEQLASDNGWNRETTQRLLWERQDEAAVPIIEALLASTNKPLGRLHALHTLHGLKALRSEHLRRGLKDAHPRVRAHAIRLLDASLRESADLLDDLLPLADDPSEHVRFQLAFSLGESSDERAIAGLSRLARDPRNAEEVHAALLSSVGHLADKLVESLISDDEFLKQKHASTLLSRLGLIVGANPDVGPALRMLSSATQPGCPLSLQRTVLTSLGQGLSRRGSSLARVLAADVVSKPLRARVAGLFERATALAADDTQTVMDRGLAIQLLAFADLETAGTQLPKFLLPQSAQSLQRAAVSALARQESDEVAAILLGRWRTYSPQVRRDVVDSLMSSPARIQTLLAAVESKAVKRGDIERDKKQLLMKHPNKAVNSRSQQLFGGEVDSDRAKVVASYQDVLDLEGDVARGLAVFKKKCAVCHQVGTVGHLVAPNLASVQNKSLADLLIAVLDPNREAQPNFNVYSVLTEDGKIYTGMIATETGNSITLRRAEAKEDVILRSNIDELVSTGASLMPEGLEKDVSRQDLADVIAFVKSIKPAKTNAAGN
ncbi:MAG: dehydrogenase [Planctomycetaceae bacterium]|nr:dehydrogenase [Planctomycetaceae bacterium]